MEKFFEKESFLAKAVGAITAIGALFLNIPTSADKEAGKLLANVQVFWLLILTILLLILFVRFVKYLIEEEKKNGRKYNLPMVGTFSATTGFVLLFVVMSLWGYVSKFYTESFANILKIVLPGIFMAAIFYLNLFVKKNEEMFTLFSECVVDSFSLSFLASIAGVYIQEGIIGYFYFYWLGLFWPFSFIVILSIFVATVKIKRKSLFKPRK